jgi:hypothetical protein
MMAQTLIPLHYAHGTAFGSQLNQEKQRLLPLLSASASAHWHPHIALYRFASSRRKQIEFIGSSSALGHLLDATSSC